MKRLIISFLFVCAILPFVCAQDAEYLLLRHNYVVNNDGTSDYTLRKELQLLRNRSFANYGQTYIIYNPAFESVKINEAYTLLKNGTRVPLPDNAVIEQLPYNCVACARFNGLREMVIVHTALEYDATIVLDYTIHRRSQVLDASIQMQQDCPVRLFEVNVKIPSNQQLVADLSKAVVPQPQCTITKDNHSFSLSARQIPQTFIDSYLPSADKLYTVINLSNGLKPLPTTQVQKIGGASDLLDQLRTDDKLAYMSAIRNHVRDNIRTNAIAPSLLQYPAPNPQLTWNTSCGTLEDKAALLASLIHQAGCEVRINAAHPHEVLFKYDGMEYQLSVADKREPQLFGVAEEDTKTVEVEENLSWDAHSDELADGYYRVTLPSHTDALQVSAASLWSDRTAPIQVAKCKEHYQYTVSLPKGSKLVGDKVSISDEAAGVGRVEIAVKQSGRKLKIERTLSLEKDIIMPADYEAFRRLMQLWAQHRVFFVKTK